MTLKPLQGAAGGDPKPVRAGAVGTVPSGAGTRVALGAHSPMGWLQSPWGGYSPHRDVTAPWGHHNPHKGGHSPRRGDTVPVGVSHSP